ncbi:TetR/AcrR family transcriptional regulator [Companilactobacillus baiquanensis]|uniref:TetR/AcrR family transcriptional regulator n=1 Tax=Companilactobacillus baiquanensis TaxID=2486005 RepID=A0ABW1UV85_9LACO|nr:TetR family transcriptional regulator [Companilactobacillus baiquanensis]
MKIDVTKHLTLGAKRTLKAFRMALFEALGEKEFDKITVNDICKKSEYPRATFYNYFDDKYDLLQYFWSYIGKDILSKISDDSDDEEGIISIFNLLLDFFDRHQDLVKNITKNNGVDSNLWRSMSGYLRQEANKLVYDYCSTNNQIEVPAKLLARFYSDLIIAVLEWCLFEQPNIDSKTADKYLTSLLNGGFK